MATPRKLTVYRCIWEKASEELISTGISGRWNYKGDQVIYASESRSLATLEVLVHAENSYLLSKYKFMEIIFPGNLVKQIGVSDTNMLRDINEYQHYGQEWFQRNSSAILSVPSVIIPNEHNYVINTRHLDIRKVKVSKVELFHNFDPRLRAGIGGEKLAF